MSEARRKWMSLLKERERIRPFSTFLFCFHPQLTAWCPPTLVRVDFT